MNDRTRPPSAMLTHDDGEAASTPRGAVLALRWLGVLGVVIAVVVASTGLATSLARTDEVSTTTVEPGLRVLEVEVDAGTIEVLRGGREVEVVREVSGSWRLPATSSERVGDRLVLTGTCSRDLLQNRCRTSYTLRVPDDVELVLTSSAGQVLVEGGTAPVTATTSAGQVTMTELASAVVSASSSAGQVSLAFTTPPEQVEATTSTGAVEVVVPDDGTTYDVQASSSVGASTVSVPVEPGASRRIVARTSVGAVEVRPASPVDQ